MGVRKNCVLNSSVGIISIVVVFSLALCVTSAWADSEETPLTNSLVARGKSLYQSSDFTTAIKVLQKAVSQLTPPGGTVEGAERHDLIQAHLYLGLCNIGINNNNEAKKQFIKVVTLDSDFTLDPMQYSQKVVALFNETRAEYFSSLVTENKSQEKSAVVTPRTGSEEKKAKPFYKKWWFWTAAGVGAVAIAAAAGQNNKTTEDTTNNGVTPLFEDNFDDGDFSGWTSSDGSLEYWHVEGGMLTHETHSESDESLDWLTTGELTWQYQEIDFKIGGYIGDTGNYQFGFIFGYRQEDTYSMVVFSNNQLKLVGFWNGVQSYYQVIDFPIGLGKYYDVKIMQDSHQIMVYVDGVHQLSSAIAVVPTGKIGVIAANLTFCQFDNVKVWENATGNAKLRPLKGSRSPVRMMKQQRLKPVK